MGVEESLDEERKLLISFYKRHLLSVKNELSEPLFPGVKTSRFSEQCVATGTNENGLEILIEIDR